MDEVGRGCLAGPVVAAAVILPASLAAEGLAAEVKKHRWLARVRDSKLVPPEIREELVPELERWARAWAIGVASVEEIDKINIFHASHLAMKRAVDALGVVPERIIVDGNYAPKGFPCPVTPVVKGDQLCLSVAAASIIAKVWRDKKMQELDALYPGYGFASHKGYSAPVHFKALDSLGPCEIHRRSFSPVAIAQAELDGAPRPQLELFNEPEPEVFE
jgi:ribonuclease HII